MNQQNLGRNDPCICGSGKKFKKCCGNEANSEQIKPDIQENIGYIRSYYQNGDMLNAMRVCKYLLEYYPENVEVLKETALILYYSSMNKEAENLMTKAISLSPDNADLYFALSGIYSDFGGEEYYRKSLITIEKAVELDKKNPTFLWTQAHLYSKSQEYFEKSIEISKKIIKDYPTFFKAYHNLYKYMLAESDYEAAEKIYDQFISQNPPVEYLIAYITYIPIQFFYREDIERFRKKIEDNLDHIANSDFILKDFTSIIMNNNLFALNYHAKNNRFLLEKLAFTLRKIAPNLTYEAEFIANWKRKEKIKIGFITCSFNPEHPVMLCFQHIIERLATNSEYEVVFLDIGCSGAQNPLVKNNSVQHIILPYLFNSTLYEYIIEQECDIIAYLDPGSDPRQYLLAFSRLAPIQICFTGQPITNGLSTLDYYISSDLWEPENAQDHYTEKLIRLKNPVVSMPKREYKPLQLLASTDNKFMVQSSLKAYFGFPEEGNLYACPVTLQKIHPDFYDLAYQILLKDPKARIVFFKLGSVNYKKIEAHFQKICGDEADRIIFVESIPNKEFPHAMELCDAILDPVHFGLASTLYQLFCLGTPIVTWPGEFLPGRIAYGLYKWMQTDDLIAKNFDDYVNIAVKLANDKQFNQEMRKKIKEKSAIIYGDTGSAEEVELILKQMVDNHH